MDDEERNKWIEAGRIAGTCREMARDLVKPGASFLEVAETIEDRVREMGAEPAFPVNVSINEDAAHDTPMANDERVFGADDVVKVDIGAQIDGYIGDTATTVCCGSRGQPHAEAARAALDAALGVVRAGVEIKEIGRTIQATIESHGLKPISNLTGHSIERYTQHAGLSIPNIPHGNGTLEAGQVIAIEPFATDGTGHIIESRDGGIYHFQKARPQRNPAARDALQVIQKRYDQLPFASRWVADVVPAARIPMAFKLLERAGVVHGYGVLREAGDGLVAQAEHTVIVEDDGCTITTKVDE